MPEPHVSGFAGSGTSSKSLTRWRIKVKSSALLTGNPKEDFFIAERPLAGKRGIENNEGYPGRARAVELERKCKDGIWAGTGAEVSLKITWKQKILKHETLSSGSANPAGIYLAAVFTGKHHLFEC